MLKFKYDTLEEEFDALEERLQCIVYSLSGYIDYQFKKDLIITSIYRDQKGSVHKYWRGVDFRITPKGGESVYSDEEIDMIKKYMNRFMYSDIKQHINTLRVHDAGSGLHGHIQVNNDDHTLIRETDA